MIEKKLEDIMSDGLYLDPAFLVPILNISRDGSKNAENTGVDHDKNSESPLFTKYLDTLRSTNPEKPDDAWEQCINIINSPIIESYLKVIGNDHIMQDLKQLKPTVFLCVYYYACDYLYRQWVEEGDEKIKKEVAGLPDEEAKKAIKQSQKQRKLVYNMSLLKHLHNNKKVIGGKGYKDRALQKLPNYLAEVLLTSVNQSNPIYNLNDGLTDEVLDKKYESKDYKALFSPELILFIQKIYNVEKFTGDRLTKDEIKYINASTDALTRKERLKEAYKSRFARIDDYLKSFKDNYNVVINYISVLTPIIFDSVQCFSGHKNAKGGHSTLNHFEELSENISKWIALHSDPIDIKTYNYCRNDVVAPSQPSDSNNQSRVNDKTKSNTPIINEILAYWAIEDLFHHKRFNRVLATGFQYIVNNNINWRDKSKQLNVFKACSLLNHMPLELIDLYMPDVLRTIDLIATSNSDKETELALLRVIFLIDVLYPSLIHLMVVLCFRKIINEPQEIKNQEIKNQVKLLEDYIVKNKEEYSIYLEPTQKLRTLQFANARTTVPIFEHTVERIKKKQISTINKDISTLSFEDIHAQIVNPSMIPFYWDQIFTRKRLWNSPCHDLSFYILFYITDIKGYLDQQYRRFLSQTT